MMVSSARHDRRGFALFVVFMIATAGLLLATSAVWMARAERSAEAAERDAAQLRALAWSGLQAVMAELDSQREAILAGQTPEMTESWSLFGTPTSRGTIRLLPVAGESLLESESAKLDLNAVDAEMLTRLEAVGEAFADRIIAARAGLSGERFHSPGDLLAVEGVTAERLYGALGEISVQSSVSDESSEEARFAARLEALSSDSAPVVGSSGWRSLLTTWNYEPVLQNTGRYKINLAAELDDRMRERIERRFGPDLVTLIEAIKNDPDQQIEGDWVYQALAASGLAPEEWDQYLDAFTVDEQQFYHGRVDLNRASASVLAAVPGLDAEKAAAIVNSREALTAEQKGGVSWLVSAGILSNEEWVVSAPYLTARSFVWRVRVQAQILRGGGDDVRVAGETVWEAVIDLSSPRARVAHLQDITRLETAADLLARAGEEGGDDLAEFASESLSSPDEDRYLVDEEEVSESGPFGNGGDEEASEADEGMETPSEPEKPQIRPIGRWTSG